MRLAIAISLLVCPALLAGQTFSKRYDMQGVLTSENSFNLEKTSYGYIVTRVGGFYTNLEVPTVGFLQIVEGGNEIGDIVLGSDTTYNYAGWANSGMPTSDGNYVVGGTINIPSSDIEGWLCKHNENGEVIWESSYGLIGKSYYSYQAIQCNDGGYALVGFTDDFTQSENWYYAICLLKFDSVGEFEWIKKYTGSNQQLEAETVCQTMDNGFLIGGASRYLTNLEYDHILIKTDSLGNEQWREYYGNENDEVIAHVAQCADGNFVFCSHLSSSATGVDPYIAKIDSADGSIIWDKILWPHSSTVTLHKIIELDDGSFVSAGVHHGAVLIDEEWESEYRGLVVKVDENGDSLWNRLYVWESPVGGWLRDIIQTDDGGFIACGQVYANDDYPSNDTWVIKMDEYGCVVPGCHVSIIEQEQVVNFLAYPNPASDVLNVYFESLNHAKGMFQIFDMQGRVVKELSVTQSLGTYMFDVSGFYSGLYLLTYTDNNQNIRIEKPVSILNQ